MQYSSQLSVGLDIPADYSYPQSNEFVENDKK